MEYVKYLLIWGIGLSVNFLFGSNNQVVIGICSVFTLYFLAHEDFDLYAVYRYWYLNNKGASTLIVVSLFGLIVLSNHFEFGFGLWLGTFIAGFKFCSIIRWENKDSLVVHNPKIRENYEKIANHVSEMRRWWAV